LKPVVFVFPTFLAVGGVERNTVEVIAKLKDKYDFVVVTFERLSRAHGSLHHQFFAHCRAVYDLAEIGSRDEIATYLERLRVEYTPEIVWICNGCPWLAANTATVRSIFCDAAIVDQQVYDTELGWVSLYRSRDPGMLSFDRHIAINSKIRDVFIEFSGISSERIDLIYPVISDERRTIAMGQSRDALISKFGLDPTKRYFATIGRLAPQKAPLDFVELVRLLVKDGNPDLQFLMVGSGELESEVAQRLHAFELSERVTRIGYVENVFELTKALDGIVFTSLYEGLPIALLEALSMGTPGICTDVGDVELVFKKYGNGVIFDRIGDPHRYKEKFDLFLRDYAQIKGVAIKNMDAVATDFSIEAARQKYLKCFDAAKARGSRAN
jgi:glycosyltransferase involved in cell wall biosynthesis